MSVVLQFLGSGDAFGDGGRFQAAFALLSGSGRVLVDCGASTLIALKRARIDPSTIDAIVVSHYHGDHFGGIPFFVLDAQFAKRERPLVIAGPAGVAERVRAAFDVLFPGSAATPQRFGPRFLDLPPREAVEVGPARVTAVPVEHTPGTQAHGLRIELDGRSVGYSGDTAWTEALVELASGTDAFVCECYTVQRDVPGHLSLRSIARQRSRLRTPRLILTHLGPEPLQAGHVAGATLAHDGLVVTLE